MRDGAPERVPSGAVDLDRPALVFEGERRSHRQLRDRAGRIAAGLGGLGVGPGDPVAVLSRNCLEGVEAAAGIDLAGAASVHLDPRLPPEAIAALLARSGAAAAFVEAPLLSALATLRRAGEATCLRTIVALGAGPGDLDYEELCSVAPLGARADFACAGADAELAAALALDAGCSTYVVDDVVLDGRATLVRPLLTRGGEVHLRRSGPFAAGPVLDYMDQQGITHAAWAPAMLRAALAAGLADGRGARRLRGIVCAGGPFVTGLLVEARRALPGVTVLQARPADCRFGQFPPPPAGARIAGWESRRGKR